MAIQICITCRKVSFCDFFPCSKCFFGPMFSGKCVKILVKLHDYSFLICESCFSKETEDERRRLSPGRANDLKNFFAQKLCKKCKKKYPIFKPVKKLVVGRWKNPKGVSKRKRA